MNSLRNQLIIIILITLSVMTFTYIRSNDSKITYSFCMEIGIEHGHSFMGSNYYLWDQEMIDFVEKKKLDVVYRKPNRFYLKGNKEKITKEFEIIKQHYLKLNDENYKLTKKNKELVNDHFQELLTEIYLFKVKFRKGLFYESHIFYDYTLENYKRNIFKNMHKIIDPLKNTLYYEHNLEENYKFNKNLLNNLSIKNFKISKKSKTRFEKINIILIIGFILMMLCIVIHKRKNDL